MPRKYDMTLRNNRKRMHDLRRTLDQVRRRERKKHEGRSREERRLDARTKLLDELVPDRKCPSCGIVKLKSKQWVVQEETAICLGCHRKEVNA